MNNEGNSKRHQAESPEDNNKGENSAKNVANDLERAEKIKLKPKALKPKTPLKVTVSVKGHRTQTKAKPSESRDGDSTTGNHSAADNNDDDDEAPLDHVPTKEETV